MAQARLIPIHKRRPIQNAAANQITLSNAMSILNLPLARQGNAPNVANERASFREIVIALLILMYSSELLSQIARLC
jgi:hypothetical protein